MTQSQSKAQNRRLFLNNLAFALIKPHLENRAILTHLPSDIKVVLEKYKPRQEEDITELPLKTRKRCRSCRRSENKVTTINARFVMFMCAKNKEQLS